MAAVTITHLQQTDPRDLIASARVLDSDARIELVRDITPEFSRFLYQGVGSNLHWADRLSQSREQWEEVLRAEGSETYVLYVGGGPQGYIELTSAVRGSGTEVEIFYFGLFPAVIGRGYGGILLSEGTAKAWSMHLRWPKLPPVTRVWLHTCSLDDAHALPNYRARGFTPYSTETVEEQLVDASTGLWPADPTVESSAGAGAA